jgi:phage terminase large subunit GpA-like protein
MTYLAVDSGYQTMTVYEHCRRHRPKGLMACKGIQAQGRPLLGKPTYQDVNRRGRSIKGGVQLWPIGVDAAKERIYRRLDLTAKTDIGARGAGLMHFPSGLPDEYFAGLVSEKLIRRNLRGMEVREWVKTRERNEPLDLEVLCYAAAMRAGIARMNWAALKSSLESANAPPAAPPVAGSPPAVTGTPAPFFSGMKAPKRPGFWG